MGKKTARAVIQRLAAVDLLDRASSGSKGIASVGVIRALGRYD